MTGVMAAELLVFLTVWIFHRIITINAYSLGENKRLSNTFTNLAVPKNVNCSVLLYVYIYIIINN